MRNFVLTIILLLFPALGISGGTDLEDRYIAAESPRDVLIRDDFVSIDSAPANADEANEKLRHYIRSECPDLRARQVKIEVDWEAMGLRKFNRDQRTWTAGDRQQIGFNQFYFQDILDQIEEIEAAYERLPNPVPLQIKIRSFNRVREGRVNYLLDDNGLPYLEISLNYDAGWFSDRTTQQEMILDPVTNEQVFIQTEFPENAREYEIHPASRISAAIENALERQRRWDQKLGK